MDAGQIAAIAVGTMVTTAIAGWFVHAAGAQPDIAEGAVQLRYPKSMRVFMYVAGLGFVALALVFGSQAAFGAVDAQQQRSAWFTVPIILCLGLAALAEVRVHLVVDAQGIRGRTAYRGLRTVCWRDVAVLTYSPGLSTFKLVDQAGQCLRVSRFLHGHAVVLDLMQNCLPERVWQDAIERYRNAG